MDVTKKIKAAEGYAGIKEAELSRILGTSPQAFGQRMKTGKFTAEELEKIAAAIGAEYVCFFRFPDGTEI